MKVFNARYFKSGPYGWFEEYEYVIVAETSSVALGMALETKIDSEAKDWTVTEIDTNTAAVHLISSSTN